MALSNDDLVAMLKGGKTPIGAADERALKYVLGASADFAKDLEADALRKREEEERERIQKELLASLGENDVLLSTMTGGRLPKSGVDRVFNAYAPDHFPEEVRCDIPVVDPSYYWDADLLEAMWLGYYLNKRTLLVGPPGTGKTSAVKQLAAILRQPFGRFNGKDGIDGSAFLGSPWAYAGGMEWRDGLMPQCVSGDYLTVIDEVMKLPPGIQMAMQSLYEDNGFLMLDEKPGTIADKHIYPSVNFRLFATDNTKGTGDNLDKYSAGQFQDVSTLDRFGLTYDVDYLPRAVEIEMLTNRFPTIDETHIKKITALAKLVRESFKQGNLSVTLSPRGLMNILDFVKTNVSLETAIEFSLLNKIGDDQEVNVVKKFIRDAI